MEITLLSTIAGTDFPVALRRQAALGLRWLDLKDGLWGQTIEQIDGATAERAASLCRGHGLGVDSFSTGIGRVSLTVEVDERAFRAAGEPALERALRSATVLRPRTFRLLLPMLEAAPGGSAFARLQREFPWVVGVYREWVDRIAAAGLAPIMENEVCPCLFATPADITGFFAALDRPAARYTWDVQNLWQSGVFPSLEVYRELRPLTGALHLKGGRSDAPGGPLTAASPLEEASWPVLEIVRAAVADGATPVLCLNPSHGRQPPGWDIWETACRDLAFLRREISDLG